MHVARKCAFGTVVDPFCGVGLLVVRLARTCRKVIAVDKDSAKIRLARRKAVELGVAHRIEFRVGDSFAALSGLTADAVITSPPWTAPVWDRNRRFSAEDFCSRQKGGLDGILEMAREIAPRVVLHVPKTIHMSVDVSRDYGFGRVEIEHVSVEGWKNSSNAFYTYSGQARVGDRSNRPSPKWC
jgi:trimethylguanosine synthase